MATMNTWRDEAAAVWAARRGAAEAAFREVLGSAMAHPERGGMFDASEERIIQGRVERLDYGAKLPAGSSKEERQMQRVFRLLKRRRGDSALKGAVGGLLALAKAYGTLKGRYYIYKRLTPKAQEDWTERLMQASENGDVELRRVCDLMLKGIPEAVTDFTVQWHYAVERQSGQTERLVTLANVWGEVSRMVLLSPRGFARPSDWREWLLSVGGYSWSCGERELNALQADANHELVGKLVREVATFGYHEQSGMWFFEDCAIGPDGAIHRPDKQGMFWVQGRNGREGWTLRRDNLGRLRDRENQEFVQKGPKMRPGVPDREDLPGLWRDLCDAMFQTIGGMDGFVAMGMVLAYAAMPELFKEWNATPGLWLHGTQSQGKTSVARWLIRIWGFMKESGTPLPGSTGAKMRAALQQYCNLPLWLDEYQPFCPPWQVELVKNIYDRSPGMKMDFGDQAREMLTSVIVTGVATSSDAQAKSRYAHVQVSSERRQGDHYRWMEDTSRAEFYQIGRHVLTRRPEFVKHFMELLRQWMDRAEMRDVDARARMVHGVAYAGWGAAARLFGTHGEDVLLNYRTFLDSYCRIGASESGEAVNVNQFWSDVLAAAQKDAFGETPADLRRFFHVTEREVEHPPGAPTQTKTAWRSVKLYFLPQLVLDALRAHKRKQGLDVPLNLSDLRSQMRVRGYWVPCFKADGSVDNNGHRQRFAGGSPQRCWCVDLDRHEMGYRPCTDEEYYRGLFRDGNPDGGQWLREDERDDPRRGDLYVLVEMLRSRESEGN